MRNYILLNSSKGFFLGLKLWCLKKWTKMVFLMITNRCYWRMFFGEKIIHFSNFVVLWTSKFEEKLLFRSFEPKSLKRLICLYYKFEKNLSIFHANYDISSVKSLANQSERGNWHWEYLTQCESFNSLTFLPDEFWIISHFVKCLSFYKLKFCSKKKSVYKKWALLHILQSIQSMLRKKTRCLREIAHFA